MAIIKSGENYKLVAVTKLGVRHKIYEPMLDSGNSDDISRLLTCLNADIHTEYIKFMKTIDSADRAFVLGETLFEEMRNGIDLFYTIHGEAIIYEVLPSGEDRNIRTVNIDGRLERELTNMLNESITASVRRSIETSTRGTN